MTSTISIKNIDLIRRRLKKQTFFYFWRISIPMLLILTILFSLFYDEAPLIFTLFIFLFFLIVDLTRRIIWINPHSKQYQRYYSIELNDNQLVERMGKTITELELTHATSYINRFGVMMVNNKSNIALKRIFDLNYINIPPEIDDFNHIKAKIEEKTCANNGEHP